MDGPTEQEIKSRAYELWHQAGCPEGKDNEFYHQAEQELREREQTDPARPPETR